MFRKLSSLFYRSRRRPSAARPARLGLRVEALEERQLLATVPIYHSLPGAPAALYLDFTGYTHHPRVKHHQANATKLTAFIRQKMGW